MLRWLCALDYVVEGREHLPARSTVVLMKHSSAWETLAQLCIFPRQTWVLKRELTWLPVFGWVLLALRPIAINRRGGSAAVQQVLEQGAQRLAEGLWVVIFPEGTRVPAGQTRRYGMSGALLASGREPTDPARGAQCGRVLAAAQLAKAGRHDSRGHRSADIHGRCGGAPGERADAALDRRNSSAAHCPLIVQMSRLATASALRSMNSRRGST